MWCHNLLIKGLAQCVVLNHCISLNFVGQTARSPSRVVCTDMEHLNMVKMLQLAETPLYWVGAVITASLALWLLYHIISSFRIWVLGNGNLLSPKLGKWAGELNSFIHSKEALQEVELQAVTDVGDFERSSKTTEWSWRCILYSTVLHNGILIELSLKCVYVAETIFITLQTRHM